MKTEFTDVSETQKTVTIEIDSSVVDAEIDRVAQGYKKVKVPGFRPGKVPATIIKKRFRDQILHEVMHGLIPRAVEEALQERGIEPIDTHLFLNGEAPDETHLKLLTVAAHTCYLHAASKAPLDPIVRVIHNGSEIAKAA